MIENDKFKTDDLVKKIFPLPLFTLTPTLSRRGRGSIFDLQIWILW
jgi:hypothetical protein